MARYVARNWFMATAPPQIISVAKSEPRFSKFETIVEESIKLGEICVLGGASVGTYGEVAPAPVIKVKRQMYESTLETIWEETIHYAEVFVSEAADVILRPVLRLNY